MLPISTNKKMAMIIAFMCLFGSNLFAQTNKSLNEPQNLTSKKAGEKIEIAPAPESFKLSTANEPKGNTLEAQIARAEFYKAQYAHDPATQAKYQQTIDALKKEQAKTSTTN